MSADQTHIFIHTDTTFAADVLRSRTPVLVDFRSEWCGPCKAPAPMLAQLASDYGGRVKVAKLEIDRNPKSALADGVRSAPTMLLFKGGQVQATQMGSRLDVAAHQGHRRRALGVRKSFDRVVAG